jgi:hypothetical protein
MADAPSTSGAPGTPIKMISLTEARTRMEDCDIILCRGVYGVSKMFEKLTKRAYSHAAVVAKWGDHWMLCQAEAGGVQAVPLHITVNKYNGAVYWYKLTPEARQKMNQARILREIKHDLGVPFGIWPVLRDLAYRYMGFKYLGMKAPTDTKEPGSMFCSQYVAHCFRTGGLPLCDHLDINTLPADIQSSKYVQYVATIHQLPGEANTSLTIAAHAQSAAAGNS